MQELGFSVCASVYEHLICVFMYVYIYLFDTGHRLAYKLDVPVQQDVLWFQRSPWALRYF